MPINTDINARICLQILQIWRQIKSTINDFAIERGLTSQQIFVLYSLYNDDHILMGTLAKHLQCDASNVTWMVDRLESSGLIERRELPEDRRAKQLTITPKGRALIESLIPLLPTGLGLEKFSAQEIDDLHRSLDKLTT